MPEMLPQHDLDAQRTLGRAWITLAGRKALELEQAEAEIDRLKAELARIRERARGWPSLYRCEIL